MSAPTNSIPREGEVFSGWINIPLSKQGARTGEGEKEKEREGAGVGRGGAAAAAGDEWAMCFGVLTRKKLEWHRHVADEWTVAGWPSHVISLRHLISIS